MTIYDIRVQKEKNYRNQGKMVNFFPFPRLLAISSRKYDTQACCKLQGSSKTYADIGLSFKVFKV